MGLVTSVDNAMTTPGRDGRLKQASSHLPPKDMHLLSCSYTAYRGAEYDLRRQVSVSVGAVLAGLCAACFAVRSLCAQVC